MLCIKYRTKLPTLPYLLKAALMIEPAPILPVLGQIAVGWNDLSSSGLGAGVAIEVAQVMGQAWSLLVDRVYAGINMLS